MLVGAPVMHCAVSLLLIACSGVDVRDADSHLLGTLSVTTPLKILSSAEAQVRCEDTTRPRSNFT